MAYTNDPGTQANGAAGSQSQPSITNAAMQKAPATGQNPAMAAASAAAQSYANVANPAPPPQPKPVEAPVPYGEGSDEWLNRMQSDVRASGAQTMSDQMRALQAQMATRPGMLQSGASAAATADLYRRGGNEMQSELSKAMFQNYNDERNRRLQSWGTKYGTDAQLEAARYGADAQSSAAGASANAQLQMAQMNIEAQNAQFAREMDLKEGLGYGGLGLDWYTAEGQLGLGWGGLANERYGMENQFDLGMGQLDFGYAQMDNDYLMQYLQLAGGAGADLSGIAGGPGWTEGLSPEMIAALQGGG